MGSAGTGLTVSFTIVDNRPQTLADYRDDFQPATPAANWQYLWNAAGAIGTASNYTALLWDGSLRYDSDGAPGLPDASDMGYGSLHSDGLRTGRGTGEGQSVDRYAIAAYTAPQTGYYAVADSLLESLNGASTGLEIRIYIGDNLLLVTLVPGGESRSFDTPLGYLQSGETIYVAFGPDGSSGSDVSDMDFSITFRPATAVADFRDDFVGGSPVRGWQYLWNAGGAIGDATNYTALLWDGSQRYDSDGAAGLPDATDMGYGSLHLGGARTGYGTLQGQSHDRYSIAAWTVNQRGCYALEQATLHSLNSNSTGVEVRVYAGDDLISSQIAPGGGSVTFNGPIGYLQAGDVIYVAIGPDGNSGSDVSELDFVITWLAGETVSDFSADFQAISPTANWRYLWNEGGAIGTAANYTALLWDNVQRYDSDGTSGLPDATQMSFGSIHQGGVRTGLGTAQGAQFDHYAIAAWTVPERGFYVLEQGQLQSLNINSTGVDVRVYRNDLLLSAQVAAGGGLVSFEHGLGYLQAGDVIHVAIGPDGSSGSDVSDLDFNITRCPGDTN